MCSLCENVQVIAKQVGLTTCHECYGHLGKQNLKSQTKKSGQHKCVLMFQMGYLDHALSFERTLKPSFRTLGDWNFNTYIMDV
jgi:hypothetical protein